MRLTRGDITLTRVDAVVNAADSSLLGGGGVDGAIHCAGGPSILAACQRIVRAQGPLPAGEAVITGGGNLPARVVIHTVGPVWHDGDRGEAETLARAHTAYLALATRHDLASIAFPSISSGAYGYPVGLAAGVATGALQRYLRDNVTSLREIIFMLFNEATHRAYTTALEAAGLDSEPGQRL